MTKKFDVVSICNALMDILIQSQEEELNRFELTKGVMHLVDADRQKMILDYFLDRHHVTELGGSAMNAIRTLAQLGAKTAFAGMVGTDEFGQRIQKRMQQLGIQARILTSSESTGSCAILITPDGERTMNTHLGASRLFDETLVPAEEISQAKVFHFSGYQWDTDGQKRAIRQAIAIARKNQTMVSFDVADPFVVDRHREEFIELIAEGSDVVFANEAEAKLLYQATPEVAAQKIAKTGSTAVIKLGAKGALVCHGNEQIHISPEKTTVVDTTAAGDMFAAGFLYGYYRKMPLATSGKIAAILASDVISRVGATVSPEAFEKVSRL